jgi:predicted dehydrogenase
MKLTAVVDVNPEAARAFGVSFDCSFFTSLDDYLTDNNFADCAIICTPPARHADIATRLMQRGTSILCETPFTLDSASAAKMIDVSRAFGVQLMMGSKFRYITDIIHAKGLIQSGILGQILVFEIDFRNIMDVSNRPNFQSDTGAGGGVLMDSGNHAVDIARYLFGSLLRIRVEDAKRIHTVNVEETVRLDMRTVSGVIGTANLSWTIKNACNDYIRVYGTQGTLCIGWGNSMYRLNGTIDWIKFGEGFSTVKALTRQMENLMEVVNGGGVPETEAEDGYESVRAIESAYRSLPTGQWVNLQPSSAETGASGFERKFTVLRSGKSSSSAI